MQSFRTELENPVIEKDILELEEKIRSYQAGNIDKEKFRSLRLARGVYGQRQQGVHMVRIKVPYGKLTTQQLIRVAELSEKYSNGNIHFTTRQDIQFHYVSLDDTPQLWAELERDKLTMREACGNTVRNITASPEAGTDANEPFDVTHYADALFKHFLRNPVGQDLGRKIKIGFSSSEHDSALTFIHDIGFIPKVEISSGKIVRGFKVLIGGGLGAQPFIAQTAFEFLPADEIIPFSEALIRVFDRYGERNNRHKARLKYLVQQIGMEQILKLVAEERDVLPKRVAVAIPEEKKTMQKEGIFTTLRISHDENYQRWKSSNVREQKQQGLYAVNVKIRRGNINSDKAKALAATIEKYAEASDFRITLSQSLLLRFVPEKALPALYLELRELRLDETGANALADITSCPGTDTCNLGISNSTGVATVLENIIMLEFPQLASDKSLNIKISGCMNSCGQHGIASIGFHGSSLKSGNYVIPALQLILGGGSSGNGAGKAGDKIIKFPSKRAVHVLRTLLNDYQENSGGMTFNTYYIKQGKNYFYNLVKPFTELNEFSDEILIDWNAEDKFGLAVGVGECAGVKIDLTGVLIAEAEDKLFEAERFFLEERYADSAYSAYSSFIHAAKALLLKKDVLVNSQFSVLSAFEEHFDSSLFGIEDSFIETVLQIKSRKAEINFTREYISKAQMFLSRVNQQLIQENIILN